MTTTTPPGLRDPAHRAAIGAADDPPRWSTLHGVDFEGCGLGDLGRPEGYLERQVRRFARAVGARADTRPAASSTRSTAWLQAHLPEPAARRRSSTATSASATCCSAATPPVRLLGIVDWEMATLGDPLADVGYLCAHLAERGDPGTVMTELQPVTREDGFPDSSALALRYAELTGRSIENLGWYRVLAVWKSAIFLEQSYARYLAGNDADPWFAEMGDGVPGLVARARREAGLACRGLTGERQRRLRASRPQDRVGSALTKEGRACSDQPDRHSRSRSADVAGRVAAARFRAPAARSARDASARYSATTSASQSWKQSETSGEPAVPPRLRAPGVSIACPPLTFARASCASGDSRQ